jgi:hypothetical protein
VDNVIDQGLQATPTASPVTNVIDAGLSTPATNVIDAGLPAAQHATSNVIDQGLSAQPAAPRTDPLEGTIKPWAGPSVWDRIKNVFVQGTSFSTRGPNDPKYGQMQLLSPEEMMTGAEQERHPILTGVGEFAGGMTSPESVGMMAVTGGLGELPGAAAMIPRLVSAGFGTQAIYSAIRQTPEIRAAFQRGDTAAAERLITKAVLNVGVGALAAKHAATGSGAITGKSEPAPLAEDIPVHPSSSIAEALNDADAPDVRVVDSSASKSHLIAEDTVHNPNAPSEEPDAEASVRGPSDIASLRAPTARIVADSHVPVVAKSEVLAETIQTAINNSGELAKLGIDPSTIHSPADAEAQLALAADHIRTNLDPRASAVLGFDLQKQLASDLGMSVEELLSRKSGEAMNAEHAIAARGLLDASGRRVVAIAQQSEDNTALADALAQHQAVMDAVKGVSAEAGRALGSFRVQPPETQISNALRELSPEALDEARTLLRKIDPNNPRQLNQWLEQVKPSSTADKLFELYRNSLLSGPATLIKKAASDAAMIALETTSKLVAGGLSQLQDSPERFASEAWWYSKGAVQTLQFAKAILTGEFDLQDSPGFESARMQAIKGPLGNIIRTPSAALSRVTNLAYAMNYFGELNAQAARMAIEEGLEGDALHARQEWLAHNPTAAMSKAADTLALKATFQAELGKTGKAAQSLIRNVPLGRYLIPFFKTPVNILKSAEEFSPSGLLRGTLKGDVDLQARGLVGSSLAAGIAYLALNGHITGGGPVDFRKRETLEEAIGWQPYSVKIGSHYYSYRRLEPVGLAFALTADAVHSLHQGDAEVVSQSKVDTAAAHIARNLQDVAFLPTLSNLAEALTNPGARAQAFISREIASVVPALVKDVAQATDRTVRRPTGIVQTIESRVPGLTQRVPAVVDISGQPVKRPASAIGGANPFPVSTAKDDPTVTELARLGVSTTQPPTSIKLRGKASQLSQIEQQTLAEQEGQALTKAIAKMTQSKSWANITDDQKRARIAELRRDISDTRASRVAKMRKQAQAQLASASL